MRTMMAAAVAALALVSAPPARAQSLDEAAVRAIVEQVIRDNPQLIIDSVNAHMRRADEERRQGVADRVNAAAPVLLSAEGLPVLGNPRAQKTVVYFFDYRCGFCKRMHNEMKPILAKGDVRVILREFPILGPASTLASRVSVALFAERPDLYARFHDQLKELESEVDEAQLTRILTGLGVDARAIIARSGAPDVQKRIADNLDLGRQLGISGTPFLYVAPQAFAGFIPAATLEDAIAAYRAP